MRRPVLAALVSAGSVVGCGTGPGTTAHPTSSASDPPAAAAPPRVAIEVHEDVASDRWVVTYSFPSPVMGAAFVRRATFRAEGWTATADGGETPVEWGTVARLPGEEARSKDAPAILASGTKAFRTLSLSFATDASAKPGDYLLNVAFSDGGRAIYTGDLAVDPLDCADARPCKGSEATRRAELDATDSVWSFTTDAKRSVVVLDQRGEGSLAWTPTTLAPSDGTYAYFGRAPLRETPSAKLIIDEGFPRWMVDLADAWIPKLLDHFARRTVALQDKPLLLLSFGGATDRGRTAKGGGLPGLAQLAVSGEGWVKESPEATRGWLVFLGHELFHRWNGAELRPSDGDREPWLGEGSSDYFARRALLDLGAIDADAYHQLVVGAANTCVRTLGAKPLLDFHGPGNPEYACGATLFAMADVLVRTQDASAWDVFGAALKAARDRPEKHYDTRDVLGAVARITGDASSAEPLRRVLEDGVAAALDELFAAGLRAPDFPVALVSPKEAGVDKRTASREVGLLLARCDCDRRVSFTTHDDGPTEFGDVPECNVLRGVRLVSVAGFAIPADAIDALGALLVRDTTKPIVLGVDGSKKPLELSCIANAVAPTYKALLR